MLPKIPECEGIRRQLSNSGTSIGANFEEADGALTRKDFVNKAGIARKEAKETRYWLMIINGYYLNGLETDIQACEEIINILSAILINAGAK
jgi:four helix bundle protein